MEKNQDDRHRTNLRDHLNANTLSFADKILLLSGVQSFHIGDGCLFTVQADLEAWQSGDLEDQIKKLIERFFG